MLKRSINTNRIKILILSFQMEGVTLYYLHIVMPGGILPGSNYQLIANIKTNYVAVRCTAVKP